MDWPRRALVIVHGIGVQARGTTRDALVAAMEKAGATHQGYFRGDPVGLGEPPPPVVRRIKHDAVVADVYEVYWAPHASRMTSVRSVLWWMVRSTFLPGDALKRPSRKTLADVAQVVVMGAVAAFLVLLALTTLGNLTEQASCATDPTKCSVGLRPYAPADLTGPAATWQGPGQLADAARTLWRAVRLTDRPLDDLTPSNAADVLTKVRIFTWLALGAIVWLSLQVLHRVTQLVVGGRRLSQTGVLAAEVALLLFAVQFAPPVLVAFAWVLAIATGIVRGASAFLSESIGDVQIYANTDENSKHFAARAAILAEAERTFAWIAERKYDEVVVFGHSLGSVVAFDVIENLRFRDPPLLPKIKAFITFGTAIEKVRYLFDQKARGSAERDILAASAFARVAVDRPWINIWYGTDVVANPITSLDAPGWEALEVQPPVHLSSLFEQAREAPLVNVKVRRLWPPWPPIHSYYLKDEQVLGLLAEIALTPSFEPTGERAPG